MSASAYAQKFLVNPYQLWAEAEGVPIYSDQSLNLRALRTAPWARFGLNGCIIHIKRRCDFLTIFIFDLNA